ncbi:hypothetical protein DERP_013752 [Dermatophagoides pteronyssinus]|uniref:Uncharacterized protein n=1 Tax=Dermatophagoides pteronyssinus TaxID=6956 RepID=A0ABQ8JFD9_DERPT|nr:hypothetical protein DERP_013752 [Dermatophagoides pteronyssinus]
MIRLSSKDNHCKRLCLHLLMIIQIIIIWMANNDNGVKSIIIHRINNRTKSDLIRFPYKSVYGLSRLFYCHEDIYNRFYQCEILSHNKWKITIDDYFYETKEFCCFVWDTMDCELNVAVECNQNYSLKLEKNTKEFYTSICERIGSTYKSWSCWWTYDKEILTGKIIGIVLSVLTLLICVYTGYRGYRWKLKTNQLNKEKRLQMTLEQYANPNKIIMDPKEFKKNSESLIISKKTVKNITQLDFIDLQPNLRNGKKIYTEKDLPNITLVKDRGQARPQDFDELLLIRNDKIFKMNVLVVPKSFDEMYPPYVITPPNQETQDFLYFFVTNKPLFYKLFKSNLNDYSYYS